MIRGRLPTFFPFGEYHPVGQPSAETDFCAPTNGTHTDVDRPDPAAPASEKEIGKKNGTAVRRREYVRDFTLSVDTIRRFVYFNCLRAQRKLVLR